MSEELRIPIRYFGLDADRHQLDLVALGQSLQGASRIIDLAASIAIPSRRPNFRILSSVPSAKCYEIQVIIAMMQPFLPVVIAGAQKAVEDLVSYGIASLTKKPETTERAMDIARISLEEMGQTSRAAIEAVRSMGDLPKSSAKKFLSPVGKSCDQAIIGNQETGAIPFDITDKDSLEAHPIDIGPTEGYNVLITEIDLVNGTCKFALDGEPENRRHLGKITDPSIGIPMNAYSSALAQNSWLKVSGKAELNEGRMTRLFISDAH